MRETSASEPLLTHRKEIRRRQNRRLAILPGRAWRASYLLSMRRPVWRRRDSHSGFCTERENLIGDVREKAQAAQTVRPKVSMLPSGSDCSIVAMKRGNARGPKGAGHRHWARVNRQREEPDDQWKAAAFARWHEPDELRGSSPVL